MKRTLIIFFLFFVTALITWVIYINVTARRLPDNSPACFIKAHPSGAHERIVVCAGDSITHGSISCNYVEILGRRLAGYEYLMVNAGINGEFSWNLLQRTGNIIKCNPSYITIMIGTNDADVTLDEEKLKLAVREFKLPSRPSKAWFRENLIALSQKLKSGTHARIALLSLPPIGERLNDTAFKRAAEFSLIIRETAVSEKLVYLPLNEGMTDYLKKTRPTPKYTLNQAQYVMYRGIIDHYGFGVSYDRISRKNGFVLLTDFLHLNCIAAGMVADLIEGFIRDR